MVYFRLADVQCRDYKDGGLPFWLLDIVLEIGRPVNIFATNCVRAAGDVNYPIYVGLVVMWSVSRRVGYLFGIPLVGGGICGMVVAFFAGREYFAGQFLCVVGTA